MFYKVSIITVIAGVLLSAAPTDSRIIRHSSRHRTYRSHSRYAPTKYVKHSSTHFSGKMSYYLRDYMTASGMRYMSGKPSIAMPKALGVPLLTPVRISLTDDPNAGHNFLANDRGPAGWTGFAFDGSRVARDEYNLSGPGSRQVHVRVIGPPLPSNKAAYAYLDKLCTNRDAVPDGEYKVNDWVLSATWYKGVKHATQEPEIPEDFNLMGP